MELYKDLERLMELCGNLSKEARISGRCLECCTVARNADTVDLGYPTCCL